MSIKVKPAVPTAFTLALRIPNWCHGAGLKVNGESVALDAVRRRGYACLKREWCAGDRVELVLPMPVERIEAHPAVREDQGRVALQRGPIVYCLEEVDNGPMLNAITLPPTARLTAKWEPDLLGGVMTVNGRAKRVAAANWQGQLYRPAGRSKAESIRLRAVPYCTWANRGLGEMITWIRSG